MSNHTELGQACTALYTLHRRSGAAHELGIDVDEITSPLVLGIQLQRGRARPRR
jgi:hypothetical protein